MMRELRDGLQKLLCLSLEGQPSADVIAGTLLAWAEVLTTGRVFEQDRDAPRFRAAFRTLASRARRWPAPVDFIEALPRIETKRPGLRLESDAARQMRMSSIAEISAKLGINRDGESEAAA